MPVTSRPNAPAVNQALIWLNTAPTASHVHHGDCEPLLESLPDRTIDLALSSPPYFIGKAYDQSTDLRGFIDLHQRILPHVVRSLKDGGSLCWQVGSHVAKNVVTPLEYPLMEILADQVGLKLRNRIVWTFGHGRHSTKRFSGRHETILWYTKGDDYCWNGASIDTLGIDAPTDVWDIPNVKSNHVEKTSHPCQFPVALAQRLVRALTNRPDQVILDPFCGAGSAGVASLIEKRRFLGAEMSAEYVSIARERVAQAAAGTIRIRPSNRPIHVPRERLSSHDEELVPIDEPGPTP